MCVIYLYKDKSPTPPTDRRVVMVPRAPDHRNTACGGQTSETGTRGSDRPTFPCEEKRTLGNLVLCLCDLGHQGL